MTSPSEPLRESERLRALQDYGVLDTPPEAAFDDLAALAAQICGAPISLVSLLDRHRQWFKAHHGLALTETSRAASFCTHVISLSGELLIVPDATLDPRFAGNPLVTGPPGIRFYAGVPLCTPGGHTIGTLCVIDRQPRALNPAQLESLQVLGRQVMAQLEQRRSLNEAIRNEVRLKNSQRIAGLGDWEYDFDNQRLVWSEELYRILGIAQGDSPANAEAFYARVHPDDLAFVHREKKAAAEGTRRVDFDHRIIRTDGEVRHLHQIAELVFAGQGEPVREAGTVQDITERKRAEAALRESEERFKLVARAVSDVVWDWDLVTDRLWWGEDFLTTFGYAASEIEPGIESWTRRIHPDDVIRVTDGLHHAIDTGAAAWTADYRFRRHDGSYALVQDRGCILRDANGKGRRMVGGMRDITEPKKLEALYLRAQRLDSIGTLAGGIAHDLNNVLAPILMSIELLKLDMGDDPERSRILETIHLSCRRGADLVRQVLSYARGIDGHRGAIRPRHLLDELKSIITETFPRNIQIVTRVSPDLWPIVGEATQLHQVLLNLAVNARDAMPGGGTLTFAAANITLDAQYAESSQEISIGRHVLLEVSDTGCGIPPGIREQIFEPFFTTKEVGKGTGLGLATVRAIVKNHGGFLKVDSTIGRGTTFKIFLPAAGDIHEPNTPAHRKADLPRGRDELVLVVDDEASIRVIAQRTLETFGYRVLTARNGAEAVALYQPRAPQIAVVLIDMMMPVMDGAAAIAALLHIDPSVRIIAASGMAQPAADPAMPSAANMVFLPKPYTTEALLQTIRRILDRPAESVA